MITQALPSAAIKSAFLHSGREGIVIKEMYGHN